MRRMFSSAYLFNQSLDAWDVNNATVMEHIFYGTSLNEAPNWYKKSKFT